MAREYSHSPELGRTVHRTKYLYNAQGQLVGSEEVAFVRLQELKVPYKGREVLIVLQQTDPGEKNILIPGFVLEYRNHRGSGELRIPVSWVEPLEADDERNDLTKFLEEQGLEGKAVFWS